MTGKFQSFKPGSFQIDDPRPIKVATIGAGYSGIVAGIRFLQRVQNIDFTIYDSNAGIGGTWFVNKYPGLQCDIPSHSYQLTFENKTDWSGFYASGSEILKNLEHLVDKYNLRPFIKLQHRVTCARYNEATGKWHLTIKKPKKLSMKTTGVGALKISNYEDWEEVRDIVDVLFTAVGSLSRWSWPDIAGLETFSGKVLHSADWDTTDHLKDWKDKTVGVIGVGSSAIQIVAALQPKVKHLVNYVRGKTWISSIFVKDQLIRLGGSETSDNYQFTGKDKETFKDPKFYEEIRRNIESDLNMAHPATLLSTPIAELARSEFKESMQKRLAKKPWIAEHLIPDFGVACRRLTPGPGYLEVLCEDNVSFVPALIKRVTPTGIETVDGKFQELDVIVCATGFDTSFRLDFDIIGKGGKTLAEHHNPHPKTYLSVAVDGFPNMFQALGPNAGVGAGNLLLIMERQVDYAVAATLKIQREHIKSMDAKPAAVADFEEWIDSYFPKTVFGTKCRSWYKAGKEEGRVVALWPGSPMHAAKALAHPRWEDFDYEFLDGALNRCYWFGDGNTIADVKEDADRAWYLRPENIDYPPVPVSTQSKL
ncbi:FAD/NAD-binding domain-containing protein [Pholiota conissans]|uniref:FAD/NAD-binding domain-containing protein n=1 Tax=Pholiota conissans TaxID=109636 RepID=A0A9P5ZDR9_9AGAR|nr:FAD/NAD-binding domain-containing protein [Pholiota conissans]